MKTFLISIIAIFALANTYQAHAQAIDDEAYKFDKAGLNSFLNKDYKTAESYFRKGAELGGLMSKYYLGIFYMDGLIVEKNITKGLNLIKEVANIGYYAASYHLALMYINGYDVEVDLSQARFWIDKAIENGGMEDAENLLAGINFISNVLKKGTAEASFNVGVFYLNGGLGIGINIPQAIKHLTDAANRGYVKAQHNLGYIYGSGDFETTNYSEAVKWYKKAAESGSPESQYNLCIHYARGVGVEQNLTESFKWLQLASKNGHPEAIKKMKEYNQHKQNLSR